MPNNEFIDDELLLFDEEVCLVVDDEYPPEELYERFFLASRQDLQRFGISNPLLV